MWSFSKKDQGFPRQNLKEGSGGFTIIEVVLVLAIAGLIFLVVFLALPQLQRSRRDTQRKSDAGRALTSLESYAGNNNGKYPDDDTDDFTDKIIIPYLTTGGFQWSDPSTGLTYVQVDVEPKLADDTTYLSEGEFYYATKSQCDGQTVVSGSARNVVFVMFQESGAQYCIDNGSNSSSSTSSSGGTSTDEEESDDPAPR